MSSGIVTSAIVFACAGCEQQGAEREPRRLPRGAWVRASDTQTHVQEIAIEATVADPAPASPATTGAVTPHALATSSEPTSPAPAPSGVVEFPRVAIAAPAVAPPPQPQPQTPVEPTPVEAQAESKTSAELVQQRHDRLAEHQEARAAGSSLLNLVASQADGQATVERAAALYHEGLRLATKGAWFSARNKFLAAMQLLAQVNDASQGRTHSVQALALALRAIEESEDFAPRLGQPNDGSALVTLIRSHQTPILKQTPAESLTASVALDRYQQFAQQQLTIACAGVPLGSHILHALGRVYGTLYERRVTSIALPDEKARTFYTAAVSTQPGNYAAANDLGVLEAQSGRLSTARHWLAQSLGLAPQGATLQNLAVVEQRLGNPQTLPSTAMNGPAVAAWQNVQWVDPNSFAQSAEVASDPRPAATASRPVAPPVEPRTAIRSPDRARWVY